MKLSPLALCLAATSLCATANAQLRATGPIQQKGTQVKHVPMKMAPTKAQLAALGGAQIIQQGGAQSLVSGGSDNCATAQAISGLGTFPVSDVGATTGVEGQNEAICLNAGSMALYQDVWFVWTSNLSGPVVLDMCAGVAGVDSKVAVYPGNTCPVNGTAIACNDDFCGLVSTTTFNAVNGQQYMIQFGTYAAAGATYSGSFNLSAAPTPPSNDDCSTPIFVGNTLGTFPVNNQAATTGAQGQTEALCNFFGFSNMYQDVWVEWTAPTTDAFEVSLCAGVPTFIDSRLAVYPAGGCPTAGSAIACNDDSCNFVSKLTFNGVSGQTYLLQFATFASNSTTYNGTFDVALAPPATPDSCATPLAISGPGPHPLNTTSDTTGVEGQTEALCNFFGNTAIDNDGWFEYTAGITGVATISLCGTVAGDTKVAIYPGGACPAAGTAIACNDDFCGLTSQLNWPITAAGTYLIQIGSFPGVVGGHSGTFTITESVPAPNDDCSVPTVLVGAGPYSFDNTVSSTSTQGQTEQKCLFFGSTTVDNDVWFTWTAPSSGIFELSTQSLTTVDTKIAVYDGAGCPAASAIACDDDNCGTLQTGLTFGAIGGNSYTIQVGTFPGAGGGTGQFSIAPATLAAGCQADDGISDNSVGLTLGGSIVILNRFGSLGQSTNISDVSAAYGTPLFPGFAPPNGSPVDILVYDDPNDDGNPSDAVLVAQVASTIQNVDTDIMNVVALGTPVTVSGIFFVGVGEPHPQGTFPAAFDQSGACQVGEAWYFGDPSGVVNYGTPSANTFPPAEIGGDGLPGVWLLRASCTNGPGTNYCAGDGLDPVVTTPCPCGNFGAAGNGCRSSFNAAGAHIDATGATNPDTVVLHGTGMNATGNCIFLKGSVEDPFAFVFGDGITCAGGTQIRMRTKTLTAGAADYPTPGDPSVSVRGGTPPGSGLTGIYGAFYRNAAAAFCPPATFNITNSYKIVW